ncbi:hypothetical protein EAF00_009571 [Botryotinia globosa]|nr:hypothetical protein EAF00_009571 [Botryotinia globosa]
MYRTAEVNQCPCDFEDLQNEIEAPRAIRQRRIAYERSELWIFRKISTGEHPILSSAAQFVLSGAFCEAERQGNKGSLVDRTKLMRKLFCQIVGVLIEISRLQGVGIRAGDEEDRLEKEELRRMEAAKTPEQRREDDVGREWRARQAEEASRSTQMAQYTTQNCTLHRQEEHRGLVDPKLHVPDDVGKVRVNSTVLTHCAID